MQSSKITEVGPNTYKLKNNGIESKLSYLGEGEWLLEVGDNKLIALRNGSYRRKSYSSLEKLEFENPHWKGVSLLFNNCPVHSQPIVH